MPKSQHFRANVGVAVLYNDGTVLVFERSDRPGNWQLPQGGLDRDEEPLPGALRELHEETGLAPGDVTLIGEYPDWLAYEWPKEIRERHRNGRRGQVQKWFAVRPRAHAQVNLTTSAEFLAVSRVSVDEMVARAHPMRRAIYERLAPWLRALVGHGGPGDAGDETIDQVEPT